MRLALSEADTAFRDELRESGLTEWTHRDLGGL
jgi:hypothetical protein